MLRKSLTALASLALTSTLAFSAPLAQPATIIPPESQIQTPSAPVDTQLADEIIRRLRRLGFNMIHNRLARPVEIVGDYA